MAQHGQRTAPSDATLVEHLERRQMLSTMFEYTALRADAIAGYTLGAVVDYGQGDDVLLEADKTGLSTMAVWEDASEGTNKLHLLDPRGNITGNGGFDGDGRVAAYGFFTVADESVAYPLVLGGIATWDPSRWQAGTPTVGARPDRYVVIDSEGPQASFQGGINFGWNGSHATLRWTVTWSDQTRIKRDELGAGDFKLTYAGDSVSRDFSVSMAQLYNHSSTTRDASIFTVAYEATVDTDPQTGWPKTGIYSLVLNSDEVHDIAGNASNNTTFSQYLNGQVGEWKAPNIVVKQDPPDLPRVEAIRAFAPSSSGQLLIGSGGVVAFGAFAAPGFDAPMVLIAINGDAAPVRVEQQKLAANAPYEISTLAKHARVVSDGTLVAEFRANGDNTVWRRFSGTDWISANSPLGAENGQVLLDDKYTFADLLSASPDGRVVNMSYLTIDLVATDHVMLTPTSQSGGGKPRSYVLEGEYTTLFEAIALKGDVTDVATDGSFAMVETTLQFQPHRSGVVITHANNRSESREGFASVSLADFVIEEGDRVPTMDGAVKSVGEGPKVGPRLPGGPQGGEFFQIAFSAKSDKGTSYIVVATPVGQRPVLFVPGIFGCFPVDHDFSTFVTTFGMPPEKFVLDPLVRTYDDFMQTMKWHGYTEGKDLFAVGYDWRLPVAPQQEAFELGQDPNRLGFGRKIDGFIDGVTAASLTDGVFDLSTDYLAYYLAKAAAEFQASHHGKALDKVDLFAHSTGGIVTRVYMQSAAYGGFAPNYGFNLPKINTFTEIAVPNRGASKAWNITRDNWIADTAYQIFLSKLAHKAYDEVMDGASINIPGELPITRARVEELAANSPRYNDGEWMSDVGEMRLEAAFLDLYCPTARTLTATYAFLFDSDTPENKSTLNDSLFRRNSLLLDLNDGLDLLYDNPISALILGRDPSRFLKQAHVRVIAGKEPTDPTDPEMGANTLTYTTRVWGPRYDYPIDEFGNPTAQRDIFQMSTPIVPGARVPGPGELWYQEFNASGDGTVPFLSAQGQFLGTELSARIHVFEGEMDDFRRPINHGGLNHHHDALELYTQSLGKPVDGTKISEGLATSISWELLSDMITLWIDPVEAYVTDGLGRRLGWTSETGALTEIPGSRYLGAADGIGIIAGPVVGPLMLTVIGSGSDHLVEVGGSHGGVEIAGAVSSGMFAKGERRTLPVVLPTSRLAGSDVVVAGAADSGNVTNLLYRNSDGLAIGLSLDPASRRWHSTQLPATASLGEQTFGDLVTWFDPKRSGRQFGAGAAASGLVIFERASATEPWTARSFASARPIKGGHTQFFTAEGQALIAALADNGHVLLFGESLSAGADGLRPWTSTDLSGTELEPNGDSTPAFVGGLVSFSYYWNGLNIAGTDANGTIWSVWWSPGQSRWQVANLSSITGAPVMVGGVTPYLTVYNLEGGKKYNVTNLVGTGEDGTVFTTWWAEGGAWQTANLTSIAAGPRLAPGSLSTYVTEWNGTNIAGRDLSTGELVIYWWSPQQGPGNWTYSPLSAVVDGGRSFVAKPTGFSSAAGPINVIGRLSDGHVGRYVFEPIGGLGWFWRFEEPSVLAIDG